MTPNIEHAVVALLIVLTALLQHYVEKQWRHTHPKRRRRPRPRDGERAADGHSSPSD